MTWKCHAIDHSVTFFPDGKIGPCCQIAFDYRKPVSMIKDPDRFADLRTQDPPAACKDCVQRESVGMQSYRHFFNTKSVPGDGSIVFLDIRNTNLCNLKCRVCGPYYSNQWATERGETQPIKHADINPYYTDFCTENLRWIYFAGGEPLISPDHWKILDTLSDMGLSQQVSLMYSTNLTTIRYKDRTLTDLIDLWERFQTIELMVSIDGIGRMFETMRSGADWNDVEHNLKRVRAAKTARIRLSISSVLSALNIWGLVDLAKYFSEQRLPVILVPVTSRDHYSLSAIPDELKQRALDIVDESADFFPRSITPNLDAARKMINDNVHKDLWPQLLEETRQLDAKRKENLADLIPSTGLSS